MTPRGSGMRALAAVAIALSSCAEAVRTADSRAAEVYRRHEGRDGAFRRLATPRPGEWLYEFDEPGQTLEEYRAANPASAPVRTIRLRPFGSWPRAADPVLAAVSEHLEAFWGLRAGRAAALDAPPAWRRKSRPEQWDAARVLKGFPIESGSSEVAVLGATADDLGAGDLSFVFGLASAAGRAGVFSIARFGTPGLGPAEDPRLLRRALAVSSHETGHVLGLAHCVFYACAMNGSNTLEEADARPLPLCPECASKAAASALFLPAARLERLQAFYARVGLAAEAAAVRRIREARPAGIPKAGPSGP